MVYRVHYQTNGKARHRDFADRYGAYAFATKRENAARKLDRKFKIFITEEA